MSASKEVFIHDSPPLSLDGVELSATVYGHADGRRHVYFTEQGQTLPDTNRQGDTTRIGYRLYDEGAMFLGMMVSRGLRGHHAGERLLEYFFEGAAEEDVPLIETAHIHKPLIAKELKRVGLRPLDESFVAEILPRSSSDETHVPKIHVLEAACDPELVVQGSEAGKFYEVIPPVEVERFYPLTTEDNIVALHTRYSL
ncbi:MAG TPA: hypothetical protein VK983_05210 [Candidatus Limnocylindrales bacterium]|nr:hypothetical protein [Candidatus Limnocylindrales bacterium]